MAVEIIPEKSNKLIFAEFHIYQNLFITLLLGSKQSYPNHVITRVKCIGYIEKEVLNCYLGSSPDPCYIQNHVLTNCVIKRFRCN